MPIFIDPETRQRVIYEKHSGDIAYKADPDASSTITNESIVVLGPWSDHTGSGGPQSGQQLKWAGTENSLQGTTAEIEGHVKVGQLNEVGQNATAIRRRQRFIHRTSEELNQNFKMIRPDNNG